MTSQPYFLCSTPFEIAVSICDVTREQNDANDTVVLFLPTFIEPGRNVSYVLSEHHQNGEFAEERPPSGNRARRTEYDTTDFARAT